MSPKYEPESVVGCCIEVEGHAGQGDVREYVAASLFREEVFLVAFLRGNWEESRISSPLTRVKLLREGNGGVRWRILTSSCSPSALSQEGEEGTELVSTVKASLFGGEGDLRV